MNTARSLRAALLTALAAYLLALLVLPAAVPAWARDLLLGQLTCGLAVAVLLHRARTRPAERASMVVLALGVGSFILAGNTFVLLQGRVGRETVTAVTSALDLLIAPCLLTGLLLGLRHELRHVRLIVTLDGLTGALAGAAVTLCAIAPLVTRVWDGSLEAAVSLALVFGDVLLITSFLGALAVLGLRRGRGVAVCAFGLLVFGVGDIAYAYVMAYGSYRVGTGLDGLWLCGLTLVALGATASAAPDRQTVPDTRSLVVVTLATTAAVAVLAVAPDLDAHAAPTVLALLAMLTGAARLALAFWQLRELAVVREQALTDELTGTGNRRALYGRLDELLGGPDDDDSTEACFGLALIDLDHFKEVNDSFGHTAGDELLQSVVTRFTDALRGQGVPHLLTRLGGDEFAVVLDGVGNEDAAMGCAAALHESLHTPVVLREAVLHVQASIGVALAPGHARTRSDMLFAADAAMYAAKRAGESVSLYSPETIGDRRNRLEIAEDLYRALDRDELVVEYQPVMSAAGPIVGAEALVRWDHPTRGRLQPDEFLAVAERYRLTPRIAERVLDVALSDLRRWRADGDDLRVSVNVSASDLHNERLVHLVAAALLRHGVPASALTIEITETEMMRDPEVAQAAMHALDELGVRLSVDDYGTGYSSLEYLLKLPINEIKLDREFSLHLTDERRSVAIVRSTVDLTHALGLEMVAEGVETAEALAILCELGCDRLQGWHIGRPTSSADFERCVRTWATVRPMPA